MAGETLEVTAPPLPTEATTEPAAEESTDDIEARLLQRQQALAGKLGVLEQQTLGSIRDTIGSVTDTVNSVQAVVADPMGAVQSAVMNPLGNIAEGMKDSVNDMMSNIVPTDLIRKHPFEAVGVAVAGGVVVSMLLSSRPASPASGGPPTLLQSLMGGLRGELVVLGKQLFDSVSGSLLERVKGAFTPPPQTPPVNGSI